MGADAQTKLESSGISLKQLGVWLNMNKQKNVEAVETAGQPVAVKAGLLDLLISFGTQFGLGALGIGQGLGEGLQKQVSESFGSFGTWLDGVTSGAFSSVRDAVNNVWSTTATSIPYDIDDATISLESYGKDVSLGTQFNDFVKPKIEALNKFASDLYKKDLVPGETNYSMEDAYNTVNKKFNDASKALGFPKIKLDDTISSMTSTVVLDASKAKVAQYTELINSPASTLGQCQDALDDLQSTIDDHHQLMLDNQSKMTDAKARQATLDEVDSIYSHCRSAKQQIADYEAAGDTELAADTKTWLDSFRSAIAPEIISFVDDLILFDEQRYDPAYTTLPTTTAAKPADNNNQLVGQLPT